MASSSHPLAPLGIISTADQSGLILILTALSLCFVLVSFGIRAFVRLPQHLWNFDDNVLTAATILSCTQIAVVFYEVHVGLGKQDAIENKNHDFDSLKKVYFANNYLYIVTLLFSKASVGCLYLRLTRAKVHLIATWTVLGSCLVWTIISILLISIGCSWEDAFSIPFDRWLVVGITDGLTDIFLVLMAVYLVKDLRMSIVQKSTVVFAFSMRLLAIPAIVARLYYLNPNTLTDIRNVAMSTAVVCTQIQLGYGILAASIPVLKPFMAVYEKPVGSNYATAGNRYYPSKTGKSSFKMESVRSTNSQPKPPDFNPPNVGRGNTQSYATNGSHWEENNNRRRSSHEKRDSIHSHDSRKMIIERKTDWEVRYEDESARGASSEHDN